MKASDILESLGSVNEAAVADADKARRRMPRWAKALSAAACVCLVLLGSLGVLWELGFGRAGAGGSIGEFYEGYYYYSRSHRGVYRYCPETGSEKVLGMLRYDHWELGSEGLYYKQGRRLYILDHASGKSRLLYRGGLFECSHIGFELYGEDVIVIVYDKRARLLDEYLIDGVSGEVLETLSENLPYAEDSWSSTHFLVGEREIELRPISEEGHGYALYENGENIMPEGVVSLGKYPSYHGGKLWFDCITEAKSNFRQHLVVTAEGEVKLLETESHYSYIDAGTDEFIFFSDYIYEYGDPDEWAMQCMDVASGEIWGITADTTGYPFYDLTTNGEYMYSSAPWWDSSACWEIVYEDGRPTGLRLVDGDINE